MQLDVNPRADPQRGAAEHYSQEHPLVMVPDSTHTGTAPETVNAPETMQVDVQATLIFASMEETSQHLEIGATEHAHISRRRALDENWYTEDEFATYYGPEYRSCWDSAYWTPQSMQLDVNPRADPQRGVAEHYPQEHPLVMLSLIHI